MCVCTGSGNFERNSQRMDGRMRKLQLQQQQQKRVLESGIKITEVGYLSSSLAAGDL